MCECSLCRFSIKQPSTIVSPIFPVRHNFLSFLAFASNSFPKVFWHHSSLLKHPTTLLSLFYVFSIFSAAKLSCLFLLSPYPLPVILLFISVRFSMLPSLKLYHPEIYHRTSFCPSTVLVEAHCTKTAKMFAILPVSSPWIIVFNPKTYN